MDFRIMAHSRADLWLVLLSALETAGVAYLVVSFGEVSSLISLALAIGLVFLNCTNFQCIAHNFLHNPFFRARSLNRAFSILNSLALGIPQALYRVQHLHHHKYNNDAKDPRTGTTQDRTSTYRFSSSTREQSIFGYALLGPFRSDVWFFVQAARKKGVLPAVTVEALAQLGFLAVLGYYNWRGVVFAFLPVWYAGQAAALAENYLEHHLAIPGNRLTDSVSCYGRFYNWVWFNNGYHQEHHYRPQVHWTQVTKLREEMLPEAERRVVSGAHWFNFDVRGLAKRHPDADTVSLQ